MLKFIEVRWQLHRNYL